MTSVKFSTLRDFQGLSFQPTAYISDTIVEQYDLTMKERLLSWPWRPDIAVAQRNVYKPIAMVMKNAIVILSYEMFDKILDDRFDTSEDEFID